MYGLTVCVVLGALSRLAEASSVVEVQLGDTVELNCPSNDDNHRFQFWQLVRENKYIGPINPYDKNKYKYDVLTGALTIRGVSASEHGEYVCVCKHITKEFYYSRTVELVVKRDWEEVYENDPYTNTFRIAILCVVLLVLIALVLVLYNISTDRSARFRALADEESWDEVSVPGRADGVVGVARGGRELSPLDSHGLDTELPRPASTHALINERLGDTTI